MDYSYLYDKIEHARDVLKGIIHTTRLDHTSTFSKLTNGDVYLKLENLQKTGSFKVRGAAYAMSQLSDEEKRAGVIAASAGNHAQGVAYAATRLGIESTIVMPVFSPVAKIQATEGYGAKVILQGATFDEALSHALETSKKNGMTFIHPFNDENVIAGQGTIGLEILDELPDLDVITIPVGGGGLSSGIAIAIKHHRPDVEIYGVEAASAASMRESLDRGKIQKVEGLDTICDGIAVKQVGEKTFQIAKDLFTDVVTVDEFQVTHTLFLLLERAKIVVEPAGSVGLSAFQHGLVNISGKKAVAVLSGGNINMSLMSRIIDKELYRLKRQVRLRGTILDRIGSLNQIIELIAKSGVSVIQLQHDRSDPDIAPNKAELEMVLEVPDEKALEDLFVLFKSNNLLFEVFED